MKKKYYPIIFMGFFLVFWSTCGEEQPEGGEALARRHCAGCHLFPEPGLLPRQTWENGVLPQMGARLGMDGAYFNIFKNLHTAEIPVVSTAGVFPTEPLLSEEQWQSIRQYYLQNAPEEPAPQGEKVKPEDAPPIFTPIPLRAGGHGGSLATYVSIDTAGQVLRVGEIRRKFSTFSLQGERISETSSLSPVVDWLRLPSGEEYVLLVGNLHPNDMSLGSLAVIDSVGSRTLIDSLQRPVHFSRADLNGDERQDFIICNFGNYTGHLSWYEAGADGSYRAHALLRAPGAVKTIIKDLNDDGLPDVLALMSQGNEGVFAFYNQGKGRFQQQPLIQVQSVYGSSDFELADFNADGHPDILYLNGDNADFSYSPKYYHGLRIFLNDGARNFSEAWFYPMYGATRAVVADFDLDGDPDICALAHFAEYTLAPDESLLYFQNQTGSQTQFQPYRFPFSQEGHWLVIDAGDADQDGDQDILIGSFIYAPNPAPDSLQLTWRKSDLQGYFLKNESVNEETLPDTPQD